ncbi:MAG: hypothetical protein K0Q94_3703 [Paenibacillus sp.]|nr:hypothetical protein [Paenibacillus sp.]
MKSIRSLAAAVFALLIASCLSVTAMAASYELSAAQKSGFDKLAGSDPRLESQLNSQYAELIGLQQQEKNWDARTKALSGENDAALAGLRREIAAIDSVALAELKTAVEQTKERYKPLLESYTSLNKQITAAKSLPGKELVSFLRMRADAMKIMVQLAKHDIKLKEAAYRAAKDSATLKQKKVRAAMADIEPVEATIKSEKGSAASAKKQFSENWKAFTPLIKKGDPYSLSAALSAVVSDLRQVVGHKQNVYGLENRIGDILASAKTRLPAN